jgi:hypothetical protein
MRCVDKRVIDEQDIGELREMEQGFYTIATGTVFLLGVFFIQECWKSSGIPEYCFAKAGQ